MVLRALQASGSKETETLFLQNISPAPALGSKKVPSQLLSLPLHLIYLNLENELPSVGLLCGTPL